MTENTQDIMELVRLAEMRAIKRMEQEGVFERIAKDAFAYGTCTDDVGLAKLIK